MPRIAANTANVTHYVTAKLNIDHFDRVTMSSNVQYLKGQPGHILQQAMLYAKAFLRLCCLWDCQHKLT